MEVKSGWRARWGKAALSHLRFRSINFGFSIISDFGFWIERAIKGLSPAKTQRRQVQSTKKEFYFASVAPWREKNPNPEMNDLAQRPLSSETSRNLRCKKTDATYLAEHIKNRAEQNWS